MGNFSVNCASLAKSWATKTRSYKSKQWKTLAIGITVSNSSTFHALGDEHQKVAKLKQTISALGVKRLRLLIKKKKKDIISLNPNISIYSLAQKLEQELISVCSNTLTFWKRLSLSLLLSIDTVLGTALHTRMMISARATICVCPKVLWFNHHFLPFPFYWLTENVSI